MYRVHSGQIPELFEDYCTRNCDVHDHYTWQCFFLHIPKGKGNLCKFGIRYRGVYIWNEILELGINLDTSEAVFFVKTVKKSIQNRSLVISLLFFIMCYVWFSKTSRIIFLLFHPADVPLVTVARLRLVSCSPHLFSCGPILARCGMFCWVLTLYMPTNYLCSKLNVLGSLNCLFPFSYFCHKGIYQK